jgi:hypothetical protein
MFMLLLAMTMFLSLIVQLLDVIPGFGGQVLLLPVAFFYAAAALPLWGMLFMAFFAGLMWDCLTVFPIDGKMETFFGWNVVLYGGLGAIMNGLHPMFIRGRWQIHCLLTGVLTSLLVFIEFVFVTFRREPFTLAWSPAVWKRIAGSGLTALIIAPVLFLVLNWMGRRLGHFDRSRLAEPIA